MTQKCLTKKHGNCFAHIAETAKQMTVLLKNYSKAYSKTSKSIWAIWTRKPSTEV